MRFSGAPVLTNADMGSKEPRQHAARHYAEETLPGAAVRQRGLSARAYLRVLKLTCTIADPTGEESTATTHFAEALRYRPQVAEA